MFFIVVIREYNYRMENDLFERTMELVKIHGKDLIEWGLDLICYSWDQYCQQV